MRILVLNEFLNLLKLVMVTYRLRLTILKALLSKCYCTQHERDTLNLYLKFLCFATTLRSSLGRPMWGPKIRFC